VLSHPTPPLEGESVRDPNAEWLDQARQAYISSTDWMDINLRAQWEKNIANFNSKHPPGSKYHTDVYKKRARLFRPKTRISVKKLEAAMTTAFFTNEEVVSVDPNNNQDKQQVSAASVMKSVMQYRLTNTVPWFQIMVGGIQSAAINGVVIGHVYWDYTEKTISTQVFDGENPVMDGDEPVSETYSFTMDDKPVVDLVAPENFRIDVGADWANPVNSSPFVIELIPMYVQDIKERMGRDWITLDNKALMTGIKQSYDSVRSAREKGRTDRYEESRSDIKDHEIVWVHKNIIRKGSTDWCFYTVGTEHLLSKPKKLQEMYPHLRHGERPYVVGYSNIEAFRVYPAGTVELSQELQAASNDIWNQRFENIRLAMNKRYHTRRDANIDYTALFRNISGGVVEMDDPDRDIRVIETRDVTSSAYAEQDRINMDFDEIQGNFSVSTVGGARNLNETVGGMSMLANNTNMMTEYVLRTYAETFVEPLLKQFMRVEQFYENDITVINLNQQASEFFPKGGTDDEMDELFKHELTLKVNVGINATDPFKKNQMLDSFLSRLERTPGAMLMVNMEEVIKEFAANAGFKDGSRFISKGDPRVAELEQTVQQLQQSLQNKEVETQGRISLQELKNEAAVAIAQIRGQVELTKEEMRSRLGDLEIQIRMEDTDTKRGELMLQRDALIQKILESERESFAGKPGTVLNDDYGAVPHAEG